MLSSSPRRFFSALLSARSLAPGHATARREEPTKVGEEDREWSPTEHMRDSIRLALDSDPRVPSARLGIAVGASIVALFGTVPDERTRRIVLELTRSIPGIPPVRDRLRVATAAGIAATR